MRPWLLLNLFESESIGALLLYIFILSLAFLECAYTIFMTCFAVSTFLQISGKNTTLLDISLFKTFGFTYHIKHN